MSKRVEHQGVVIDFLALGGTWRGHEIVLCTECGAVVLAGWEDWHTAWHARRPNAEDDPV